MPWRIAAAALDTEMRRQWADPQAGSMSLQNNSCPVSRRRISVA
jgi:hypothetical protein